MKTEDIKNDLTPGKGRPEWIFSCYAPTKTVPIHLFGGPQREQSFEEMRAAHYAAMSSGVAEKAIQEANNMYAEAEQQMKTILNDLDGAVKYVINAGLDHPNRLDIVEGKTTSSFEKG
jgi:nucleoporin NUP42